MLAMVFLVGALGGCALLGGAPPNPLVGTWNLTVESPLGTSEQVFTVVEEGGVLSGSISIDGAEEALIVTNLMLEGSAVTFDVVFDIPDFGVLPAKFEGTIDGDNFMGEYGTEGGTGTVTGTRAQ